MLECFPPKKDILEILDYSGNKISDFTLQVKNINYESGNVSFYELMIINTLVKIFRPQRVLEIGSFNGRTARNIAANLCSNNYYGSKPHVYTVDLPPENKKGDTVITQLQIEDGTVFKDVCERGFMGRTEKAFQNTFEEAYITQIWSDSALLNKNSFPQIDPLDFWFDFIFIDGSHSYEYFKSDTNFAVNHAAHGGIILWHDYGCGDGNGWPGVVKGMHEYYNSLEDDQFIYHIEGTSMVIQLLGVKIGERNEPMD